MTDETVSYAYLVTYASGLTETLVTTVATVEEQTMQTFGLTVDQAAEMGCLVEQIGPYVPEPVDLTGTITSFSAGNPSLATMDTEDQAAMTAGSRITLEPLTGTEEAMSYIYGLTVTVLEASPAVVLDLDLSRVDVAGLTADYVIEVVEVKEETQDEESIEDEDEDD